QARSQGLLETIAPDVDEAYIMELKQLFISNLSEGARESLRIVYTPLHGTGNVPVRRILSEAGYAQVHVVPEQEKPDPDFSTVSSPNPEEPQAFKLAIELAKKIEADLIMGTDPDGDRVGVVVRNQQGEYIVLTGNQTGGLLLDFILQRRHETGNVPPNGLVLKTIVTSELGRVIADEYHLQTEDTLTGFKYIADKIGHYEATGEKQFLFGYEESYGYLIAPFVRDKDAVQACLMIAEMGAYYRSKGMTLYDALLQLFERIGYFQEALESVTMPGQEGHQQIKAILQRLREHPPELAGMKLVQVEDYLTQTRSKPGTDQTEQLHLPVSDVLKYFYDDHSWVAIRPSGTEPKIKLYIGVKAATLEQAERKLQTFRQASKAMLQ
ncbi:MAG: alpha-D-phosphohexomutase, partial [Bacilli bacterium]|nr:alpha-D-phosphohexomutase [Bacilli bacterium]